VPRVGRGALDGVAEPDAGSPIPTSSDLKSLYCKASLQGFMPRVARGWPDVHCGCAARTGVWMWRQGHGSLHLCRLRRPLPTNALRRDGFALNLINGAQGQWPPHARVWAAGRKQWAANGH